MVSIYASVDKLMLRHMMDDSAVGNYAFHRSTVAVPQVRGDQVRDIAGQRHCLFFQTFTHPALTAIYGRTDTDSRMFHIL